MEKSFLKSLNDKIFKSSTLMTWFSFSSKILNIFLVLPLVLRTFSEEELAVYFLFVTIITTANIIDFGFKSTFVRVFSFSNAGLDSIEVIKIKTKGESKDVNWGLAERIFSSMKKIYLAISLILILVLSTVGTYLVTKSINLNEETTQLWGAWIFVIVTSAIGFYGKIYICYLEGFNRVALIRKVEGYFSFITVFSKLVVLYFWPTILALIIVEKIWLVINLVRNFYLSKRINDNKISSFKSWGSDIPFLKKLFNLAWKNGISGILSIGLTNFTGIIYAQLGSTASVNSYLLSLRVLNLLRDFSKAPFYSKIPLLAKLRAENNLEKLIAISKKNMTLSNAIFLIGATVTGAFSYEILDFIGSNAQFVEYDLWLLLSIAFFIHRYGGMHMQLYLTTNHVISHIVDTVSGLLFVIFTLLLFKTFELYAFPMAMIGSYLGFHAWVSAKYSLKSINQSLWKFDRLNIVLFLVAVVLLIILNYV